MRVASFLGCCVASVAGQDESTMLQTSNRALRPPVYVQTSSACENKGTWLKDEWRPAVLNAARFEKALKKLKISEVVKEVQEVFTKSDDCWPADFGHYGPLMIRLAWHCSGTFRAADGAGGCAGGRMRFAPEAHWADNANLDKARSLLVPIKDKFGDRLSWGDLFVLAGTLAITEMGGPTQEFCFGRIDEDSGAKSEMLNCDPAWGADNQLEPCTKFDAQWGGGQDVSGLIYVNPQGPGGDPNPYLSAQDVKRTFGRMGMSLSQTVALIGGGHAFGKAHNATGPDGVPTSGFEGPWTNTPTEWNNEYFKALMHEDWEQTTLSNGNIQWRTVDRQSEFANTMMLTADLALKAHPQYSEFATRFANDQGQLDVAFEDAWFQLTSSGKGWLKQKRCVRLDDFS